MSFWPLIIYKTLGRSNQIPLIAKNSSFIIITPVRDKIFWQRYRNSSNYTNLKRPICLSGERCEGCEGGIRKYGICASQMIHLDCVNDTFIHQKQYVYKSQFSKYCVHFLIFHLNTLRIVRKQGECFAYCRKWCTFAWIL